MPISMSLPIFANDTYTERWVSDEASEPIEKQLWKQTVSCKIQNQTNHLKMMGVKSLSLDKMVPRITSGDPDNYEGQAAAIYWQILLSVLLHKMPI